MATKKREWSYSDEWAVTYSWVRTRLFYGLTGVLLNRPKDSIGAYEPSGRMQMIRMQLDKHFIKVLGYLSTMVTCPTLLWTPYLRCIVM